MKLSITSHWHLLRDKAKAVRVMKALAPRFVRVSSLQKGVGSTSRARELNALVCAGVRVMPILGSDTYGTMAVSDWRSYCRSFVGWIATMGTLPGEQPVVQILNECNTARFTGKAPSAEMAYERFRIGVDAIKATYPKAVIVAPGLTNENKSDGKTKMSARAFLEDWVGRGAERHLDFWALHYYDTDARLSSTLRSNISYLHSHSSRPVAITETGSSTNPTGWRKEIANGIAGIPLDLCCWYTFNGHAGFEMYSNSLQQLYTL